jgi:hypothetical protein
VREDQNEVRPSLATERIRMSTPAVPPPSQKPPAPAGPRVTPAPPHAGDALGENLDLEEDVAPNLGGEDQMQDA